jgi:hypothetical protein
MNRTLAVVLGGILLVSLLAWSSLVAAAPAAKSTPVPHQAATATPVPVATATIDNGQTDNGDNAPDSEVGAAAVTPTPPGPMTSRILVFNLDASTANVGITFMNASATPVATISSFTVAPNGAVSKSLPSAIKSPFTGSAIVSSDKNVQAFVTDSNASNSARDEYSGSSGSSSILTLPLVRHLAPVTQHSVIAVQNTSATAGNVTLHLYDPTGSEVGTGTVRTIQPSASTYIKTDDLFPTGVFTGTGQLVADPGLTIAAAEQTEYYKDTASFAGLSVGDSDTTLYVPFVERRRNTANAILSWDEIYVRNNGNAPANLTLQLYNAAGETKTPVSQKVPANGQAQFLLNTGAFGYLGGTTNYFSGWATISTTDGQPLSAYVLDAQNSGIRLFGFNAIPLAQVGTKYACGDTFRITTPSQNSKINLVNLGVASANVTVKLFKPGSGAAAGSKTYAVGVNKLVIANLSDAAFAAAGGNFEGLAIVTSAGGNIVVSVNTQYASGGITSINCTRLR